MGTILEVFKEYGQGWIRLGELGFGSSRFINHISKGEEIIIVEPSEDHSETTIVRFLPVKHNVLQDAIKNIGGTLADINTETLRRGESMIVEAIMPSGGRSKIIRLTQE